MTKSEEAYNRLLNTLNEQFESYLIPERNINTPTEIAEGFRYRSKKMETAAERERARTEQLQVVGKLLQEPSYQRYLAQRKELTERLMADDSEYMLSTVSKMVNRTLGDFHHTTMQR